MTSVTEKRERLERVLVKFRAIRIPEGKKFFGNFYHYYPNEQRAKLGKGAFGTAYTVKSVNDPHQAPVACKVMAKDRICDKGGEHTIFHLCSEFAVLQHIAPLCGRLNHSVGLYHDAENIYLLLTKVLAPTPSLETRLSHVYAHYYPARLDRLPHELQGRFEEWNEHEKFLVDDYAAKHSAAAGGTDQSSLSVSQEAIDDGLRAMLSTQYGVWMNNVTREAMQYVGMREEFPYSCDLFAMITTDRTFRRKGEFAHLPEPKAMVIMKQILEGLEFMHAAGAVHRDLKPENVIVGIKRTSYALRDPNTNQVIGVQFREKIDVQIIDFGLVKHLNTAGTVRTPGPDFFTNNNNNNTKGATAPPKKVVDPTPAPPPVEDEWDPEAPLPTKHVPSKEFTLTVTPCGTQAYMSLESLRAYFDGITGQAPRWTTASTLLPKIDVFSCGVILYAMNHGKLPFVAEKSYREPSPQEKVQQIMKKVEQGVPQPDIRLQASTIRLINAMLQNDARVRPSVSTVLNDLYFKDVTDTFVYNVDLQGGITYVVDDGEPGSSGSGGEDGEGMGSPSVSADQLAAADSDEARKKAVAAAEEGAAGGHDGGAAEAGAAPQFNNDEVKELLEAVRDHDEKEI